ncbi:hypothetical protein LXA43DRAFT_583025 [Ganoderma leucocontextum]|nr:hypothetical protein LXA43DRAFT_583025 [Ganoderma leucocontextum]
MLSLLFLSSTALNLSSSNSFHPYRRPDLLRHKLELVRFPDELDQDRFVRLAQNRGDFNQLPMFTQDKDSVPSASTTFTNRAMFQMLFSSCLCMPGPGLPSSPRNPSSIDCILSGSASFHVVAPSLPGFAFSETPHEPGLAGTSASSCILLTSVFCSRYVEYGEDHHLTTFSCTVGASCLFSAVYQGGDFGHTLGMYAVNKCGRKHIKAWHPNMPVSGIPTFFPLPPPLP